MSNGDSLMLPNRSGHRTSGRFALFSAISEGIADQQRLYFPQRYTQADVVVLNRQPSITREPGCQSSRMSERVQTFSSSRRLLYDDVNVVICYPQPRYVAVHLAASVALQETHLHRL